MKAREIITTKIDRTVEIWVQVERFEGTAPIFHPPDPGEPDSYSIVSATGPGQDANFRDPVQLTADETERAILQVVRKVERGIK